MTRKQNQENFIALIKERYPEIATGGFITAKEIRMIRDHHDIDYYPSFLHKNKVSRGQFDITEFLGKPKNIVVEKLPVLEQKVINNKLSPIVPLKDEMIPLVDPNYVPFGNYDDFYTIIKSTIFYPCYITGPTGNGKSTMVEQICAKLKRKMIRINLNNMVDEDQLIGTKTLREGNIEVVEGPVLLAMRTGSILLLDEVDAGAPNTLLCLQQILEGKPYYFKLKNEMIVPAPGFNIIATANTKGQGSDDGRAVGTNVLNDAFLERFGATFLQEYPSEAIEKKILSKLMHSLGCYDERVLTSVTRWSTAIRKTWADGGLDEQVTTRRCVHIIRSYSVFGDIKKAVSVCCNRFDDMTRLAFIDLFDKIHGSDEEIEPEKKNEAS